MATTTKSGRYLRKHPEIKEPYPSERITLGEPDFEERIKAGKPLAPPKFLPGTLVYSYYHGANVPLLAVHWYAGIGLPGWHGSTPGFGSTLTEFGPARADAPTHQYEQVSAHCWRKIATLEGTKSKGGKS